MFTCHAITKLNNERDSRDSQSRENRCQRRENLYFLLYIYDYVNIFDFFKTEEICRNFLYRTMMCVYIPRARMDTIVNHARYPVASACCCAATARSGSSSRCRRIFAPVTKRLSRTGDAYLTRRMLVFLRVINPIIIRPRECEPERNRVPGETVKRSELADWSLNKRVEEGEATRLT